MIIPRWFQNILMSILKCILPPCLIFPTIVITHWLLNSRPIPLASKHSKYIKWVIQLYRKLILIYFLQYQYFINEILVNKTWKLSVSTLCKSSIIVDGKPKRSSYFLFYWDIYIFILFSNGKFESWTRFHKILTRKHWK